MTISVEELLLGITLAAAMIALWVVARFPSWGPAGIPASLAHIAVAIAIGDLAVGPVISFCAHLAIPGSRQLAVVVGALAPTAYLFTGIAWFIRSVQSLLGALP